MFFILIHLIKGSLHVRSGAVEKNLGDLVIFPWRFREEGCRMSWRIDYIQGENKRWLRPSRKPGIYGGEESKFRCNTGGRNKCFMKCISFILTSFYWIKLKLPHSGLVHFLCDFSVANDCSEYRRDQREQFEVVSGGEEQPRWSWNDIDQGATGREETFEVKEACSSSNGEC